MRKKPLVPYPFNFFDSKFEGDMPTMWIQSPKENGHGPLGHFCEENRKIYLDYSLGKSTEPLSCALVDFMEREVGGHPDRFDPLKFKWIIMAVHGKGSTIFHGQVFVLGRCRCGKEEGLDISVNIPQLPSISLQVCGRKLKLPIKTSQKFNWHVLDDEGFERLIYRLFSEMEFHNVQWLQKTRASDSGRDISAHRKNNGNRVLIQARHQKQSLTATDVNEVVVKAETWAPEFNEVIIVTSSAFTQEAVRWVDKHNSNPGNRPTVLLEPAGHIEVMLTKHPELISQLGLREKTFD